MLLTVTGSISGDLRTARVKSKVFAIASFFGSMFAKVVPQWYTPRFLPCYTLKSEAGGGELFLQGEPYLEDPRTGLSHLVPPGAPEHIVYETHRFAAFQFFVYKLSDKTIVFSNCTLVGRSVCA